MIFAIPASVDENMRRLIADLNRFHPTPNRWPIFADDAAARAANLKIGDPYITPEGIHRSRVA